MKTEIFLASCALIGALAGCANDSEHADLFASLVTPSGALACAPDHAEAALCDGKSPGDACSLPLEHGRGLPGTCRATLDGARVGCAIDPLPPPQLAVAACANHAQGDACTLGGDATGPGTPPAIAGACELASDGKTLACARSFTPPQAAIDACAGMAAGDACTRTHRDGSTSPGTCGFGADGAATALACGPRSLLDDAAAACASSPAGAACTLSGDREHARGICTAPATAAAGDSTTTAAALCVVPCQELRARR